MERGEGGEGEERERERGGEGEERERERGGGEREESGVERRYCHYKVLLVYKV